MYAYFNVCIYVYVCRYVFVYMNVYLFVYLYIFVYLCTCLCVCVYIYIYIYRYLCIYVCLVSWYIMYHTISTIILTPCCIHDTPFRTVTPVCPHGVPMFPHFYNRPRGLRLKSLAWSNCVLEPRRRHGCLFIEMVVC